jgi:hypothetical protein
MSTKVIKPCKNAKIVTLMMMLMKGMVKKDDQLVAWEEQIQNRFIIALLKMKGY